MSQWYWYAIKKSFLSLILLSFLAACMAETDTSTPEPLQPRATSISASSPLPASPNATAPSTATATATAAILPTSTPTVRPTRAATAVPSNTPTATPLSSQWVSAINSVPIYSGPGSEHALLGTLAAGMTVNRLSHGHDGWIPIACPVEGAADCWIAWDYNALYSYEGTPLTLTLPDPADLDVEFSSTSVSPDGRWQTQITSSKTVLLAEEQAEFFHVQLVVTSLADGTTWTPVSEWHAYGLGMDGPPGVFAWSGDGRGPSS